MKTRKIMAIIMLSVSLTVGCASQDKSVGNIEIENMQVVDNGWSKDKISQEINKGGFYENYSECVMGINNSYSKIIDITLENSLQGVFMSAEIPSHLIDMMKYSSRIMDLESPEIVYPIKNNFVNGGGLDAVLGVVDDLSFVENRMSDSEIERRIASSLDNFELFLDMIRENLDYVDEVYKQNGHTIKN